ncbi:unnamed protein product [Diatraea saccharalis]|uniref:SUEL-type lectin domain-containing protein n=1 Tax=Diatraea saccharalis TaxID=40085 RepID=A0A9N9QZ67_9NEOP|nr:unnamed protein product [Diatraea saccharalis]
MFLKVNFIITDVIYFSQQYSLLQTVVEACQKKPHCEFSTKPRPGVKDPCPRTKNFVDIKFKCRPNEFRSRTCCQDDVIKLRCTPHFRVAILDAQYGRNAREPVTCHQNGMPEESCMAPRSLDIVMQICHGKRRCQIEASDKVFGETCGTKTRTYLKVIYACVPLGVMMEKYESKLEDDEKPNNGDVHDKHEQGFFDESEGVGEKWGESNVNPALPPPENDPSTTSSKPEPVSTTDQPVIKHVDDSGPSQTETKQKIFIYIGVAILLFIILVVSFLVIRYYRIRRSLRNSKNGDMFSTEPPNVFNEVSDIDNDIDVSHISGSFYDPVHPDMILYNNVPGNKGTIRAMRPLSTIYPSGVSMYGNDYVPPPPREIRLHKENEPEETMSPKSLGAFSGPQFYYG